MKKTYKVFAAGLFIVACLDMYAMNSNDLKRKYSEIQISDATYQEKNKRRKMLAENNEYLSNITEFPVVVDKYSGKSWQPLDSESLMQTELWIKVSSKDKNQKSGILNSHLSGPDEEYKEDYEKTRLIVASLLLAGAEITDSDQSYNLLCHAVKNSDYWLVYRALMAGLNPNTRCYIAGYWGPIHYATTIEMAELLLNSGASLEDNVLYCHVRSGNWQLLEYYLNKGVQWITFGFRYMTMNQTALETVVEGFINNIEKSENYIRALKLLFSAGYKDEKGKALKDLKKASLKNPSRNNALMLKAVKNSDFLLQQYLYFFKNGDECEKEQARMYDFGKNKNQADINIIL